MHLNQWYQFQIQYVRCTDVARKLINLEINKIVWFVTRKNDIKKSIINKLAIDCNSNYIQM